MPAWQIKQDCARKPALPCVLQILSLRTEPQDGTEIVAALLQQRQCPMQPPLRGATISTWPAAPALMRAMSMDVLGA